MVASLFQIGIAKALIAKFFIYLCPKEALLGIMNVCMLLFFEETLYAWQHSCLHYFSYLKRGFSWLISSMQDKFFFFMKTVEGVRVGELSTIFNLGSKNVYYSKHVWYAYKGL